MRIISGWKRLYVCVKPVEFSKSARSSSILFGEMHGKLKSPQIIRRSAASVLRVARSEPKLFKKY